MNSTDRVTGQIELYSSVSVLQSYPFASLATPVYVGGWGVVTYSGVVPEPASRALIVLGLALVLVAGIRQRRLAAGRPNSA